MRRHKTVILVILISLCLSPFAIAGSKIKVEIVETTQTTVITTITTPGTPEQIDTHCATTVNGNSATGDCKTVVQPATDTASAPMPTFMFSAKAVLPDGSHASLTCGLLDKNCWAIPPTDPQRSVSDCTTIGKVTICTRKNIGVYQGKRIKDRLRIYTQGGKVEYQITGSW